MQVPQRHLKYKVIKTRLSYLVKSSSSGTAVVFFGSELVCGIGDGGRELVRLPFSPVLGASGGPNITRDKINVIATTCTHAEQKQYHNDDDDNRNKRQSIRFFM